MKRRLLLKQVMLAAAAAALAPSCTFDKKKASIALHHLAIDGDKEDLLASIAETIIPATDIPGARALNVHRFVLKMIDDCYEKEVRENFVKGLDQVNEIAKKRFGKSFGEGTAVEREEVLKSVGDKESSNPPEVLAAYPTIKQLTLQGFLTSQYIMQQVQGFEFVPGRFNGCVEVPKKKLSA
jgi:hypothetical protein